jgi:Xaa-Pro aminopeptidase
MTESELAGILEMQIRKIGMQVAFETIICFGSNGSQNHHRPGDKKLLKNDTILIDFGARYQGYCCDLTRNICFGTPDNSYRKAHDLVQRAQQAAISKVRDGALLADVDAAAREVIDAGFMPAYNHGIGHGLGLAVHEEPLLTKTSKGKLKAGQLITIEPGIYLPGKFGIRIEDDVLVTRTGCEIISKDQHYGFDSGRMTIVESR